MLCLLRHCVTTLGNGFNTHWTNFDELSSMMGILIIYAKKPPEMIKLTKIFIRISFKNMYFLTHVSFLIKILEIYEKTHSRIF